MRLSVHTTVWFSNWPRLPEICSTFLSSEYKVEVDRKLTLGLYKSHYQLQTHQIDHKNQLDQRNQLNHRPQKSTRPLQIPVCPCYNVKVDNECSTRSPLVQLQDLQAAARRVQAGDRSMRTLETVLGSTKDNKVENDGF